jgi:hypothetical protein
MNYLLDSHDFGLLSDCGFAWITQMALLDSKDIRFIVGLWIRFGLRKRRYWIRKTFGLLSDCRFALYYANGVIGFTRLLVYWRIVDLHLILTAAMDGDPAIPADAASVTVQDPWN